jgi:hypothetical protein
VNSKSDVIWLTNPEEARELLVDEKPYLSLELQAVDSYVYVYRAPGNSSILVLEPSSDAKVRCCLIGNEDLIRFSSTNSTITVNVPRGNSDIQVGSSIPTEVHSNTPKPSTSVQIIAETPTARRDKTPDSSSESAQFSTAKMPITTEHDETDEASRSELSTANNHIKPELDLDSNFGRDDAAKASHSQQKTNKNSTNHQLNLDGDTEHSIHERGSSDHPDVHEENPSPTESEAEAVENDSSGRQNTMTKATRYTKKRRADAVSDSEFTGQSMVTKATKATKKRRAEANQDVDDETARANKRSRSTSVPRITLLDEDFGKDDDLIKPKKRGRAKKTNPEGIETPKPQQRGSSVVIPSKTKNAGTPSPTAKSIKAATNSFDAAPPQCAKPTVVFSSSNFEELTQLLKNFKNLATVAEGVTDKTDYVW